MTTLDPSTGKPLPSDAIQRILYITAKVHVYQIPPLLTTKGHNAAQWQTDKPIFTARLRILETAIPTPPKPNQPSKGEIVSTAILLEDPSNGDLFAAAPYTHPSVVEHCLDSSRFFALRVVGDGGRKATLGIGFEERSDSFDFGVTLQEAQKVLGFADKNEVGSTLKRQNTEEVQRKDFSLKDGETITVNMKGMGHKGKNNAFEQKGTSLPPLATNSSSKNVTSLPPPPRAVDVKRRSKELHGMTAQELGFDDGEFGEFQ